MTFSDAFKLELSKHIRLRNKLGLDEWKELLKIIRKAQDIANGKIY